MPDEEEDIKRELNGTYERLFCVEKISLDPEEGEDNFELKVEGAILQELSDFLDQLNTKLEQNVAPRTLLAPNQQGNEQLYAYKFPSSNISIDTNNFVSGEK